MGEQRFTIQKASGMYLHLPIFDNGVEMADGDVCILLNEQQSTISALKEENDILKQKLRKNYIANKQYEEMKRLQEENEQLRTQLLICQQSKKDDGRFQVWEVPPITMGKRISFTTNNDGDGV